MSNAFYDASQNFSTLLCPQMFCLCMFTFLFYMRLQQTLLFTDLSFRRCFKVWISFIFCCCTVDEQNMEISEQLRNVSFENYLNITLNINEWSHMNKGRCRWCVMHIIMIKHISQGLWWWSWTWAWPWSASSSTSWSSPPSGGRRRCSVSPSTW